MNIAVVGTGYVGLIAGLGFAEFGFDVTCVDTDTDKLAMLRNGKCPIYEHGADQLLERHLGTDRISFTEDIQVALKLSQVVFIAVGTPEDANGDADLSHVFGVAGQIGRYIDHHMVIVNKSTVPVGTARRVSKIIQEELDKRGVAVEYDVASNPEFLREGKSVQDFFNPDRIVLGVTGERDKKILLDLYRTLYRQGKPIIVTKPETAEMIKYASNAFLATKIAFINEIANLCEVTGANVLDVAHAMGADGRISSKFLHPGPGYGGSCFPKDTKALCKTAKKHGLSLSIVDSVVLSNEKQKKRAANKVIQRTPPGSTLGVLGLSFKPDTDDIRESPAIAVLKELERQPYQIQAYDPQAMQNAREVFPDSSNICWCDNVNTVISGCDALIILTEWAEFRSLQLSRVAEAMRGKLFFDFRNIYQRDEVEHHGLEYIGTGV